MLSYIHLPARHRHRHPQPAPVAVALHQPQELALEAIGHQHRAIHRLRPAQPRRLALPALANVALGADGVDGAQRGVSAEPMQVHRPGLGHAVDQQAFHPYEPKGWGFDSLQGYYPISAQPRRK